jgi:hypothetical protein
MFSGKKFNNLKYVQTAFSEIKSVNVFRNTIERTVILEFFLFSQPNNHNHTRHFACQLSNFSHLFIFFLSSLNHTHLDFCVAFPPEKFRCLRLPRLHHPPLVI